MKKKIIIGIVGVIAVVALLQALGIVKPSDTGNNVQQTVASTSPAETTMAETTLEESTSATAAKVSESEEVSPAYTNSAGEQVDDVAVYDYFNNLLDSSDNPTKWEKIGNEDMEVNSDEWLTVLGEWNQKCADYEENAMTETAEKFGITPEEVKTIYFDVYEARTSEKPSIKILYGELLETTKTASNGIVVKTKITPSYSNKATIEQNYFNVEDIIKNQDGSQYEEIQYWAVADMADGSEGKVISFTVNKTVIQGVLDGNIVAIQFGDYVDDLYVLPSLLK